MAWFDLSEDQQEKDATLSSESTPSRLENGLRNILRQTFSAYGDIGLNSIGLSFSNTGVLSLNQSKLDEALANDPMILEKIFANTGTTSNANVSYLGATSKTQSGTYAINITQSGGGGNTIAGTLGGVAGSGSDNILKGGAGTYVSGNAEGLSFSVVEGVSGNLGTITFNKGLGSQLEDWIKQLNEEGGMLNARTTGLNGRLSRLDDQEERLNLRLDQIQKRYRAQFTALDTMLASMQQTSTYLSQQLSALSRN